MKVLLVNGSPRANSNTLLGLHEMQKVCRLSVYLPAT